jgi:CBS domain-containing protein
MGTHQGFRILTVRGRLVRGRGLARAAELAITAGKVFAGLFALAGLFTGNLFLLIAAFLGAEGERRAVHARALLGELRVAERSPPRLSGVGTGDDLYAVGERMLHEKRLFFPVVDAGLVLGTISLEAVERVRFDQRRATPVRQVMRPATTVASSDRVADVLGLVTGRRADDVTVVDDERFMGTVSRLDVVGVSRLQELQASQHLAGVASGRTA